MLGFLERGDGLQVRRRRGLSHQVVRVAGVIGAYLVMGPVPNVVQ